MLLATTLIVAIVSTVLSSRISVTYSAQAVLLANPGATALSPGSADEATALAITYSGLITDDRSIMSSVAKATGLLPSQVVSDTSVTVINATSLFKITFTAATPAIATKGTAAIVSSISGSAPVSKATPAGTIITVQQTSAATRHSSRPMRTLILGLLLGFILGIILLSIWERADPRYDRPAQITTVLGIPARAIYGMSSLSMAIMVSRWFRSGPRKSGRVALVAATPGLTLALSELTRRLANTDAVPLAEARSSPSIMAFSVQGQAGTMEGDRGSFDDHGVRMVFTTAGVPGDESGELIAQHADVTVLVVPRGARVNDVFRSLNILDQLDIQPIWALMIDPPRSDARMTSKNDSPVFRPLVVPLGPGGHDLVQEV